MFSLGVQLVRGILLISYWSVQVCVMIHSGSRGLGHQVATGTCTINADQIEYKMEVFS